LADGGDYDVAFNRAMNQSVRASATDPAVRRVALYDYINERVAARLDRPNVLAVRYERWFREPKALLSEIAAFLQVPLGDGPVRLRAAVASAPQPRAERDLIRRHCKTAERLGYVLD